MGVFGYKGGGRGRSSSIYDSSPSSIPNPNPDPNRYIILDAYEREVKQIHYTILKVKYEGCTNYEGTKILVYQGCRLLDLVKQKTLDPHFCDNGAAIHPVARFDPGGELAPNWGWEAAKQFVMICDPKWRPPTRTGPR